MTPLFRAFSNLFIAMTGAYGLSVTGFLALRLVGEQWTIVEIFNSFAHLLFLPAFVLIPLCLLMRRFRLIVVLIPPVVAFLLSYSVFFTPRSSSAPPDALQIHLLTYNLKSQTQNLDLAIAVIHDADADVVALQELSEEAAATFAETFAESYPYQALHPQPGEPIPGLGILSRYPITADEYWRIYFGQQRLGIEINERDITLYNVHAMFPFAPNGFVQRHQEIVEILERARSETTPTIIAGDLNMTDQSPDYGLILANYADVHREIGWGMGFTFPDFQTAIRRLSFIPPLARIDYVFHSADFQAVEARVWSSSGGSDHRPLYATLALSP
jgi:endonuclease/exonuclease/phosphatase (EEP) superfamily protein YafD